MQAVSRFVGHLFPEKKDLCKAFKDLSLDVPATELAQALAKNELSAAERVAYYICLQLRPRANTLRLKDLDPLFASLVAHASRRERIHWDYYDYDGVFALLECWKQDVDFVRQTPLPDNLFEGILDTPVEIINGRAIVGSSYIESDGTLSNDLSDNMPIMAINHTMLAVLDSLMEDEQKSYATLVATENYGAAYFLKKRVLPQKPAHLVQQMKNCTGAAVPLYDIEFGAKILATVISSMPDLTLVGALESGNFGVARKLIKRTELQCHDGYRAVVSACAARAWHLAAQLINSGAPIYSDPERAILCYKGNLRNLILSVKGEIIDSHAEPDAFKGLWEQYELAKAIASGVVGDIAIYCPGQLSNIEIRFPSGGHHLFDCMMQSVKRNNLEYFEYLVYFGQLVNLPLEIFLAQFRIYIAGRITFGPYSLKYRENRWVSAFSNPTAEVIAFVQKKGSLPRAFRMALCNRRVYCETVKLLGKEFDNKEARNYGASLYGVQSDSEHYGACQRTDFAKSLKELPELHEYEKIYKLLPCSRAFCERIMQPDIQQAMAEKEFGRADELLTEAFPALRRTSHIANLAISENIKEFTLADLIHAGNFGVAEAILVQMYSRAQSPHEDHSALLNTHEGHLALKEAIAAAEWNLALLCIVNCVALFSNPQEELLWWEEKDSAYLSYKGDVVGSRWNPRTYAELWKQHSHHFDLSIVKHFPKILQQVYKFLPSS